jgi:hypothetical protein
LTLSTAFYATFNKHSACGLKQHKKQVPVMAFCLLLLPRPAVSRYTMLLPLLPLLEQRQQWRSWRGGLW